MIFGVLGSGRTPGNSEQLLRAAIGDAPSEICHLGPLTFRGCVGCSECRRGAGACVLRDDLTQPLSRTAAASALVLAAPIYYGYPSGLFKSYLDRWYSFRDEKGRLRSPEGRAALLILTQGHPDPAAYEWTLGSLRKTLTAYGFATELLVAAGLGGADAVAGRPDLLEEAARLGARLR